MAERMAWVAGAEPSLRAPKSRTLKTVVAHQALAAASRNSAGRSRLGENRPMETPIMTDSLLLRRGRGRRRLPEIDGRLFRRLAGAAECVSLERDAS